MWLVALERGDGGGQNGTNLVVAVAVLREILQFEDGGENCVFFEILGGKFGRFLDGICNFDRVFFFLTFKKIGVFLKFFFDLLWK